MTHKLPVKEHLRNATLYRPLAEALRGGEWKRRCLTQYNMQKQLSDTMRLKTGTFKLPVCIVVPIVCLFLVFATYFGFLPLEQWLGLIKIKDILNLFPIGLRESLIFAAVVNGLTFLSMKRHRRGVTS